MIERIQRRRRKGWRQPPNTLYAGRPSKWANPFVIGPDYDREEAVAAFRRAFWLGELRVNPEMVRVELAGYDHISCWCRLDEPCHCDEYIKALLAPYEFVRWALRVTADAVEKDRYAA